MKKLVLQMQMSVDGFVGDAGQRSWQIWNWGTGCLWDAELKRDFNAVIASVDTILLSRKMVEEGYLSHWANAAKNFPLNDFYAFAQRITDVGKVVLTSKLETSIWDRTVLAKGEISTEVNALKRGKGGDIVTFGGAGLASSLIAAGLVDEYQFFINPAALGNGERIFAEAGFCNLSLLGSKSYSCGIMVNRYAPAR
ncbi:dihydrofolate reductase [Devosia sp. UYZn731]|uniref:dihydrofolate reductase family protein n=1 Tax=Devosia sp. UYZn731 TaxID=3156345 RepID=UPI00339566A7